MPRIKILIADTDREYSECLAGYVAKNYSNTFNVSCAYESMEQSIDKSDADIILVPECVLDQCSILADDSRIIVLSDSSEIRVDTRPCVLRYQHASRIIADVVDIYEQWGLLPDKAASYKNMSKVVCVYSPEGGCGKSTIATALSVRSVLSGLNAFYLNLESISSTSHYFGNNIKEGMSRVLYSIMAGKNSISSVIASASCVSEIDGLMYFNPPENGLELDEINIQQIECLINALKSYNAVDIIIVDMDNGFNQKNLYTMELSDSVILVESTRHEAQTKSKLFKNYIRHYKNNVQLIEKFIHVRNNPLSMINSSYIIDDSYKYYIPYCAQIAGAKSILSFTGYASNALNVFDDMVKGCIKPCIGEVCI